MVKRRINRRIGDALNDASPVCLEKWKDGEECKRGGEKERK